MDNAVQIRHGFLIAAFILFASVSPLSAGGGVYADQAFSEAIAGVSADCPQWILDNQVLMDVAYRGFDGEMHCGQLVVDARVVLDLQIVFTLMLFSGFPLESVIPVKDFGWDDYQSMVQNNTSAFNYRCVPGTDRLSSHSYGLAIDINPLLNPYYSGGGVSPEGAVYDLSVIGTLYGEHPVVRLFKTLGWRWGGDWNEPDYQHFDKQLEEAQLTGVDHHRFWPPWRLL
jgi:hypothetical protein